MIMLGTIFREAPMWVVEVNVLGRRFSCTVDYRRRPQPGHARVVPWRDRMQRQSGAAA
jgi:hypothetical protein